MEENVKGAFTSTIIAYKTANKEETMEVTNDLLIPKVNLIVDKLMSLGAPDCDTDITNKAGLSKGLIPRDFGIQE
jgi:dynactin complex subunit